MGSVEHEWDAPHQHAYRLPYHWCMSAFHKYVIRMGLSRFEDLVAGASVIEVGCGDGFTTSILAETAKHVTAFDLNERAIAFARQIVDEPNVEFHVGRAAELSRFARLLDDGPDVVASFEVIEHLASHELTTFLQQAREVLARRRGWLIVSTPNRRRREGRALNPHHAVEFTPEGLSASLRSARFKEISVTGLYYQPRWERLEHFANTVPFRSVFMWMARAGANMPRRTRTLLCRARAGA